MKKLVFALASAMAVVSAPAVAADLGRPIYKAPAVAAISYYNWSGCYIGAHGGYGWGQKRWDDPFFIPSEFSNHDVSGAIAGGQVGCDFQTGSWVFGIEGSGSWADLTGSSIDTFSFGTLRDHSHVEAIGTFTGRIGWAFDRTLLYVKGGGAVVGDRHRVTCEVVLIGCFAGDTIYRADQTRWGWLVGAGIEYAFTPNWSVKLEYNFMDFGRENLAFTSGLFFPPVNYDIEQQVHVVKVGINYRFNFFGGAAPLVASY